MKYQLHKAPIKMGLIGSAPTIELPEGAFSIGAVSSPTGEVIIFYLLPVVELIKVGGSG